MTQLTSRPLRLDHRIGIRVHRLLTRGMLPKTRSLLLLGTMRSGSTVLTNILISHNEIAGFAESMLIYDRPERLLDLRYWAFRYTHRYPKSKKLLFDKVLHNHLLPHGLGPFDPTQTHLIFLVRSPARTASSIAKMIVDTEDQHASEGEVWDLLETRYLELTELCNQAAGKFPMAALSYEFLVSDPDSSLAALNNFLNLPLPLTRHYKVQRWVGRWGLGDGSDNIKKGELIAMKHPTITHEGVPDRVRVAYEALLQTLADKANIVRLQEA